MKFHKIFVLLFLSFCVSHAFAQDKKRTTRLNFGDELIEGGVSSPDLLLILKSKNPSYGRLLKLRDNFLPEIRETRFDVLRGAE